MRFYYILALLFVTNCKSGQKDKKKHDIVVGKDKVDTAMGLPKVIGTLKDTIPDDFSKTDIEVLNFKRYLTSDTINNSYYAPCKDWNITKDDILEILSNSKALSDRDFHDLYYVLPCNVSGEARLNNKVFSFEINAGSFTIIRAAKKAKYFKYNKSNSKQFLLGPEGS